QPNASPASAAAATPARRQPIGTDSQPWSLAYLSSAATPASSTSMPTLAITLPVVNHRTRRAAATALAAGRATGARSCSERVGLRAGEPPGAGADAGDGGGDGPVEG